MSATNRSGKGRAILDFYETPRAAVDAVVPHLPPLAGLRILEPSGGRGAIVRALIAHGADPSLITTVEIDPGRADILATIPGIEVVRGDFGLWSPGDRRFDLVVKNPPYMVAEEHLRHAIGMLAPGGTCAALLRLPFLAEGKSRAAFRRDHPHDRVELTWRLSFTAEALSYLTEDDLREMARDGETVADVRTRFGHTDSVPQAWGLFGPGRGGRFWTVGKEGT